MKCYPMLAVQDVEASSHWYQAVLGLASGHGGEHFEILMSGEELTLCLHHPDVSHHPVMTDPKGHVVGAGVLIYFVVDDVQSVYERAVAASADLIDEPHENPNAHAIEFRHARSGRLPNLGVTTMGLDGVTCADARHHRRPSRSLLRLFSLAALLAPIAAACRSDTPISRIAYSDSAGIQVGTYAGPDRSLLASVARGFELGGEGEGPESFYELYRRDIGVSADGLVAVLNRQGHAVSVFDSSGAHLFTRGSEGDGPGELAFPSAVLVRAGGEVGVFDFGKRAIVRFGNDGTALDQTLMTVPFNGYLGMIPIPDGMILMSQTAPRGEGDVVRRLLRISGSDTTQLGPSTTTAATAVEYPSCGIFLTLPPLFASEVRWASNGSRTAVVTDEGYSVHLFENSTPARIIRRDIQPEPVTEAVVARELGDGERWGGGGRECVVPPHEVSERRGYATHLPVIEDVAVAPDGSLWVARRLPETSETAVDFFSPGGDYLGSTPGTEIPFPVNFLPDGRILAVERDDFDVDRLVAFHVSLSPAESPGP